MVLAFHDPLAEPKLPITASSTWFLILPFWPVLCLLRGSFSSSYPLRSHVLRALFSAPFFFSLPGNILPPRSPSPTPNSLFLELHPELLFQLQICLYQGVCQHLKLTYLETHYIPYPCPRLPTFTSSPQMTLDSSLSPPPSRFSRNDSQSGSSPLSCVQTLTLPFLDHCTLSK